MCDTIKYLSSQKIDNDVHPSRPTISRGFMQVTALVTLRARRTDQVQTDHYD